MEYGLAEDVGVEVVNDAVSATRPVTLAAAPWAMVIGPNVLPGAGMSGKFGSAGCTLVSGFEVGSLLIWACRNQSFMAADVSTE